MSSVGENLRTLRAARGLTQKQLADSSGVPQSTISQLETGQRDNATLATLHAVAKGLGCPVEDLVRDDAAVPDDALSTLGKPDRSAAP